jgi:FKBP-type peptidyl-prolyl cis-trans isomerase 2
MQRFVATLDANNKIIGNHIDHNTEVLRKQTETNERLIEMINQMLGFFRSNGKN